VLESITRGCPAEVGGCVRLWRKIFREKRGQMAVLDITFPTTEVRIYDMNAYVFEI